MTDPRLLANWLSGGARPDDATRAKIRTRYVMSANVRPNSLLHRPVDAVAYRSGGRLEIAVRYACGAGCTRSLPVAVGGPLLACERCEEVVASPADWKVYAFYDAEDQPLYIGQTNNFTMRRRTHETSAPWWHLVTRHAFLAFAATPGEALMREKAAIRELHPHFNVMHNGRQVVS